MPLMQNAQYGDSRMVKQNFVGWENKMRKNGIGSLDSLSNPSAVARKFIRFTSTLNKLCSFPFHFFLVDPKGGLFPIPIWDYKL